MSQLAVGLSGEARTVHPMLASLFSGLEEAGIDWTLLRLPRDLAFPPGDVDLLVRSADHDAFDSVARAAGFVPVPGWQRWPALLYLGFDRAAARFLVLDVTDRVTFGRRGELATDESAGVLARRVARNGVVLPSPEDEFWLLMLHCLLDKAAFPEHYRERLSSGARADAGTGALAALVDERARGTGAPDARQLRAGAAAGDWAGLEALADAARRGWTRATPRGLLPGLLDRPARWIRVAGLLRRRRGISIALLGTNGAGKSTLSAGIESVFPLPVATVYMGLWKDSHRGASALRRGFAVAARPFRAWGRFATAVVLRARGNLVVFDRFVYDARRPPAPPLVLLKRLYFWLLSRACGHPDLTVVLDLPGAVAFGRKGEDGIEETERERQEFLAVGRDLGARVVDATQSVTQVRGEVLALIWDTYRLRWDGGESAASSTLAGPGHLRPELLTGARATVADVTDLGS